MNKKYLPYAAIVIAVGILAAVLWPEEAPPPAPAPVVQTAPKPPVLPKAEEKQEEEQKTMRVSFINHLGDTHVNFHVDGKFICAANAGKACNGPVPLGKHVVEALEGTKVIRTLELTLHEDTKNPTVVVCFPTSPNC